MKLETVEVKAKGQLLGEFDYERPGDLPEAIDTDGEEKVFKLYLQQRKIRWRDAKRAELTGGGVNKELTKALKAADPDKLKMVAELLGIEL